VEKRERNRKKKKKRDRFVGKNPKRKTEKQKGGKDGGGGGGEAGEEWRGGGVVVGGLFFFVGGCLAWGVLCFGVGWGFGSGGGVRVCYLRNASTLSPILFWRITLRPNEKWKKHFRTR